MNDRTAREVWYPWRALYGAADGRWFILTGAPDADPPSTVEDLAYLGDPAELIRLVHDRWREAKRQHIQRDLGVLLSVRQQSVSRYLNGGAVAELSAYGWRGLVAEVFATGGPGVYVA